MRGVKELTTLAAAIGRNAVNIVCFFSKRGWDSLLRRSEATTALKEIAVQQQQEALDHQKATHAIERARDIEKIKDPRMREVLTRLFLTRTPALASPDAAPQVLLDLSGQANQALRQ